MTSRSVSMAACLPTVLHLHTDSSSCASDAFDKKQYDEREYQRKRLQAQQNHDESEVDIMDDHEDRAVSIKSGSEADASVSGDIMNLTLRGEKGDVEVKAKPTTKVSALLKYYCSKHSIDLPFIAKRGRQYIALEVEGEKLDPNSAMADCDVEDEDMIAVIVLKA